MSQVERHFTVLVYSFTHAVSGEEGVACLRKLRTRWRPWWNRLGNGVTGGDDSARRTAQTRALDDTYFFLPHVRQLLFPETALEELPTGDPEQQAADLDRLAQLPTEEFAAKLNPYGMLRLTLDPRELESINPLRLEQKDAQGRVSEEFAPVRICWIDVALLPQRVGFLFFKVELDEENLTVNRLNDFLYSMRQVHKPTIDWRLPNWKHEGAQREFTSRALVDFLLQGLTDGSGNTSPAVNTFGDWLVADESASSYSTTERGQIYGQSFRLYTFVGLGDSTADANSLLTRDAQSPSGAGVGDARLFASPMEQILYELATCTQVADPDYTPHPAGLKQTIEKGRIALWANWEGMALHDNVVFVARPTPFTRNSLAHNVESDYFNLYLLTLCQKLRLSTLSGELMRRSDSLYENLQEARGLWDQFTMFRNHYWFSEVTLKPQGIEIYRRYQQGLNALRLYESVCNEVHELQDYFEHKAELEAVEAANHLQEEMAKNVEGTRKLQEDMGRNVEATRRLHEGIAANAEATKLLQEQMTAHLNVVASIQRKVEWIEVFVVGLYFAELAHSILAEVKEHHKEHSDLRALFLSIGVVIGVGALAGLITWLLLFKPWKGNGHKSG